MDTDWVWQGLILIAAEKGIEWAWYHREAIKDRLSRVPKPIVVPLNPLNISSKLGQATIIAGSEVKAAGNVYSTVAKDLTMLWNVEESTPPRVWRLVDEALEVLSVLPRHL